MSGASGVDVSLPESSLSDGGALVVVVVVVEDELDVVVVVVVEDELDVVVVPRGDVVFVGVSAAIVVVTTGRRAMLLVVAVADGIVEPLMVMLSAGLDGDRLPATSVIVELTCHDPSTSLGSVQEVAGTT